MNLERILKEFNARFQDSLIGCSQFSPYHLENDVYTHTMMVLNEALREDKVISWDNVVVKQMKKFQLPLWGEQNKKVASMEVQYNGC